jgi:hypothetical protein
VVAVTAPGVETLPWDVTHCSGRGPHRHSGLDGCRVHPAAGRAWNESAGERYARLWKAAQVAADRMLRRHGYGGKLPRRIGNAWSPQARGVWHVHEALPAETAIERLWARTVVEYLHRCGEREAWGYVDRNPLRGRGYGHEQAAAYLARNAAGYLSENASAPEWLPGRRLRAYVSRRLTTETGVTIRALRQASYLWVCVRDGLPFPDTWTPERIELLARLARVSPALAQAP